MSNVIAIEEIDLTGDDGEEEALNYTPLADGVTPGLLLTVKQATGISAPYIENGTVYLPPGGGNGGYVPLAYFGSSGIYSPVAGIISNMYFSDSVKEPCAYAGEVALPLASSSYFGSSVAGGVRLIEYSTSVSAPEINDGNIRIPMACFGDDTTSQVAGVIGGVQFQGDIDEPIAEKGIVYLPKAYFLPSQIERLGVVQSVEVDNETSHPYILDGRIYLPPSDGALKGLANMGGGKLTWDELNSPLGDGVLLSSCYVYVGQQLNLFAQYTTDGFLKLTIQ